jgi:hypothetical protein
MISFFDFTITFYIHGTEFGIWTDYIDTVHSRCTGTTWQNRTPPSPPESTIPEIGLKHSITSHYFPQWLHLLSGISIHEPAIFRNSSVKISTPLPQQYRESVPTGNPSPNSRWNSNKIQCQKHLILLFWRIVQPGRKFISVAITL